ncbi:MAG: spore coat protein [Lawsonibacter sp.]|jgi:spore coat protein CotF|nr:spore coat protein [Lawsonibacter sp.]MCI9567395.1 spore coat protein [Lawsonibacter sp.]
MNDQERIADLLCSEKKMSANYDTFASECVNVALRDDFLNIFSRGHQTQTDLFKLAQSKGWYQVEQAPASKVSQAYTRFSNQQPTM